MKKLLTYIFAILLLCSVTPAYAEVNWNDVISKLEWKQGIAYSVPEGGINILSTFKAAKYKDITLSLGYAGDREQSGHKAVANLSYSLLKLKDYVEIPILDLVELEPGIWAGMGKVNLKEFDEWESDWGVSISVINVKF